MQKTILITGGTGMVGKALSKVLQNKGHIVRVLSRQKTQVEKGIYHWDLKQGHLDAKALENVNYIIHLAGANVFGARWTKAYKEEILKSRVTGLELLYQAVQKAGIKPHIITASGSNYYPSDIDKTYSEESQVGNDFLSTVCLKWEEAALQFKNLDCSVSAIRTSVVLSADGGAFTQLKRIFKSNLGASLGSGKQIFSWIHINDIVQLYTSLVEEKIPEGIYNDSAPYVINMDVLSKKLAAKMGKFLMPINIPGFLLKLVLGSRAKVLLEGGALSTKKIENTGFTFTYPTLETALEDLV